MQCWVEHEDEDDMRSQLLRKDDKKFFIKSILYRIIDKIHVFESIAPVANESSLQWIQRVKDYICYYGKYWEPGKKDILFYAKQFKTQKLWNKENAVILGQILKLIKIYDTYDEKIKKYDIHHQFHRGIRFQKETIVNSSDSQHSFPVVRHLQMHSVKMIAFGGCHYLLLLQDGTLLAKGQNRFGQIGDDIMREVFQYDREEFTSPIKGIACGYSSSFVVCEKKSFARGCNENGRLGVGSAHHHAYTWQPLLIDNLVKIQAGSLFACGMDKDNYLYSWGMRLYVGRYERHDCYVPIRVPVGRIYNFSIQLGGYHCVYLSHDGYLYGFGHNRVGQLGNKEMMTSVNHIIRLPTKLPFSRFEIIRFYAGWGNTAVIDCQNNLKRAGRNCTGQLGISPENTPKNFKNIPCSHKFNTLFCADDIEYVTMSISGISAIRKNNTTTMWGDVSYLLKWRRNTESHMGFEIDERLVGLYRTTTSYDVDINTIVYEILDPN